MNSCVKESRMNMYSRVYSCAQPTKTNLAPLLRANISNNMS